MHHIRGITFPGKRRQFWQFNLVPNAWSLRLSVAAICSQCQFKLRVQIAHNEARIFDHLVHLKLR